MRLLALGAGEMGEAAATTAATFDEIDEIIVGDILPENAERVAERCGGKAKGVRVDVACLGDLASLMKRCDATINSVGPFFRCGVPALEAAITAKRPYFDICDDPEPTLEMLQRDDQAKAAGIIAIVGMGASPGITNLLARMAYESLETVDDLITAWNICPTGDADNELTYSMAIVHWMQQISGKVLEWRDHNLQSVRPLREELLHYPGRGSRKVWTVGHPEPVALSSTYPTLKNSYCAMVMPSLQFELLQKLQEAIDDGKWTVEEAAHELVDISQQKHSWFAGLVESVSGWLDGPTMPPFFAVAKGSLEGSPTTAAASLRAFPKNMAEATGIPLALTARLFAQGKIRAKGVCSPEAAIRPQMFFELFHPYCQSPESVTSDDFVELVKEERVTPLECCLAQR
jgi:saccharopine dehydrogenase-like NADP-dependent oxidoreductase